jgi:hypothetical protein
MRQNLKNISGHYVNHRSAWRRIAAASWKAPSDPSIHGSIEIDMTRALEYMAAVQDATGQKVTVNHLVTKAVAETLLQHPQSNGLIRRGKIFLRDDVDISVLIAVDPADRKEEQAADLTATLIRKANEKSLAEISELIRSSATTVRRHKDPHLGRIKKIMNALPVPLLRFSLRVMRLAQYDYNLDLQPLVPRDPFGSALITSIGTFCVRQAHAPIPPFMNVPIILAIGAIEKRAVVRDNKVVIRKMLPLSATIDHRLIDGFQGAKLSRTLEQIIENPAEYWGMPEKLQEDEPAVDKSHPHPQDRPGGRLRRRRPRGDDARAS